MNPNTNSTVALRDNHQVAAYDPTEGALSTAALLGQVQLIQEVMKATMRDGEHYGKIPGCGDKPTLLKPGAEKLCLVFRFAPSYEVGEAARDGGHREYRVTTTLRSILTGALLGQGIGICSTMEGKYRFRGTVSEVTDRPVPRAYWDLRQEDPAKAQELIGGKGFGTQKVEGKGWMITKGSGEKKENDNPADHYNTVLKMAKKRALVDAVLTATAASDIFTQDLEDIGRQIDAENAAAGATHPAKVAPAAASAKPARRASVPADLGLQNDVNEYRRQSEGDVDESNDPPAPATCFDGDGDLIVPWGKNEGRKWRELTDNQREFYMDQWAKKPETRRAFTAGKMDDARANFLAALDEMVKGDRSPDTGLRNDSPALEMEVVETGGAK